MRQAPGTRHCFGYKFFLYKQALIRKDKEVNLINTG